MDDKNMALESEELNQEEKKIADTSLSHTKTLSDLYEDWFLDYASYVVLERAVPDIRDGYKPVQRRILHSMKEIDDGRYNKVANIIGHTMKYHPHGDRSIGDALVQLGQRELLVDMQGNWGNIHTGDSAAAPRYIEARLSKFALEVVFNPKTTKWNLSYDGRNKEPDSLPVKFPMLLVMGVEGIAVGMASKLLPHNFNELIDASINHLLGKPFDLYPDFITGGMADVSKYNDGIRGGKVRVRAKINKLDTKTLVITELPFSTNTTTLIESIISATDKGNIKIKKIEDNTAENVEIVIHLGANVSPDQTIDALYAFTRCEDSISPNSTVISGNRPVFIGMKEILRISTDQTVGLLKLELQIKRDELLERWHFSSLEKIFIRERLYRNIEEAESFENAIEIIDKALDPYKKLFKRPIVKEDIERLTEIKIRRISKYNEFKADEVIKGLEDEIDEVDHHLANLIEFAINYFKKIKEKYGKGRERKTELRNFDNINAASVAVNNVKLYVNREEGFVGTSLRKDEFVVDCSDLDDVIVFREDGNFQVTKVADKTFVGKDILHVGILKRNDDRTIYNMIYRDGKVGNNYVKRFAVTSVIRDKLYDLTKGNEGSKVIYFTANPNGEAEVVKIKLRPRPKLKKLNIDFDFSDVTIKGRNANGNIITKNIISKITLKEDGVSTLGAMDIWYDPTVKRLNTEERGLYLGAFSAEDEVLNIMSSGVYKTTGFDLTTHFADDLLMLQKFDSEKVWTAVYWEGESSFYYLKRFKFNTSEKDNAFISEDPKSKLLYISDNPNPQFNLIFDPKDGPRNRNSEMVNSVEFIDEKSYKAKGKRLSTYKLKTIKMIEPEDIKEVEEVIEGENIDGVEEVVELEKVDEVEKVVEVEEVIEIEEVLEEEEPSESLEVEKAEEPVKKDAKALDTKDDKDSDLLKKPTLETEATETKPTKAKKPKTAKQKKVIKPIKPEQKLKVSLDGEEPLQMELDL